MDDTSKDGWGRHSKANDSGFSHPCAPVPEDAPSDFADEVITMQNRTIHAAGIPQDAVPMSEDIPMQGEVGSAVSNTIDGRHAEEAA